MQGGDLEVPNCLSLVDENVKHRVKSLELQEVTDPFCGVKQDHRTAVVKDCSKGTYQLSIAGTVHIGHARQVDDYFFLTARDHCANCFPEKSGPFPQRAPAVQVEDSDVTDGSSGDFHSARSLESNLMTTTLTSSAESSCRICALQSSKIASPIALGPSLAWDSTTPVKRYA